MSNAETIRAMFAAFNRQDSAAATAPVHPEIVWDMTHCPIEDLRGVYRGREGSEQVWRRWLEAWEQVEVPEMEVVEAGEHVFVWIPAQRNRGRTSGIEVTMEPYGWVWTFRDGRIVHAGIYDDRRSALDAAGLEQ
jgi:ketosteroid isomerase-like protein